jgi:hypothetical protein
MPARTAKSKAESNTRTGKKSTKHWSLPRRKAIGFDRTGETLAQPSLERDTADQFLHAATLVGVRIHIRCVIDEGGMNQISKTPRWDGRPTQRGLQMVMGEAPPGVEGHAIAVDGTTPQQSLESKLRGHHIHGLSPLQQRNWMAAIHGNPQARMAEFCCRVMATPALGDNIRMNLEYNEMIRMIREGIMKHPLKACPIGLSVADRKIPISLINNKNVGLIWWLRLARGVIFTHPR